jgi:hypothetical protein
MGTEQAGNSIGNTRGEMRFTQIGSLSALVFSILALCTSIYQTQLMQSQTELMQKQSRASVWPYVTLGENSTSRKGEEAFSWRVDNNGVGPAKIESVVVRFDGKTHATWEEIFNLLAPDKSFHSSQTSINGMVLPPSLNRETTIEMVKFSDPALAHVFMDAKERFQIEVCYCSVYDDCWVSRLTDRNPHTVPVCKDAGNDEFKL